MVAIELPIAALLTEAQAIRNEKIVYGFAKRMLDITVSVSMIVALAPLFAVIALIIKLTDGGSIFFAQTRVGKDGQTFRFYKFRSMVANADALKAKLMHVNDHGHSITFKMKNDPRITWIGRFIRKTSIDELPQLLNVLTGEMSLVGPRPAVPTEVAKYTAHDRKRLAVTPGLTCIWQVSGRGDIPFDRQVELDLQYINNRSLWLDLVLIGKTASAVLSCRGAY